MSASQAPAGPAAYCSVALPPARDQPVVDVVRQQGEGKADAEREAAEPDCLAQQSQQARGDRRAFAGGRLGWGGCHRPRITAIPRTLQTAWPAGSGG
jgi:hypothetical protein